MDIRIIKVHLSGGHSHEHITSVQWTQPGDSTPKTSSRADVVDYIETRQGTAHVLDSAGHRATVRVVTPAHGSKYLRTYRDGIPTDNLLNLPKF